MKSSAGLSLIEVVIASMVTMVAASQLFEYMGKQNKITQKVHVKSVMQRLADETRIKLNNPKAIYWSVFDSKNSHLAKCLLGPECNLLSYKKGDENLFYLKYPTEDSFHSYFSGTTNDEIFYDIIRQCKSDIVEKLDK